MKVLIVFDQVVPVTKYGGIQRIVWWLAKELTNQGHTVTLLVAEGSSCPFAKTLIYNPNLPLNDQVPDEVDLVHSYLPITEPLDKPYLIHMESNTQAEKYDKNTVFVSQNHAERHNATAFVYNGLDPDDYGRPSFNKNKDEFHFLGKAAWRVKNVKGAISIAQKTNKKLHVLGGKRLNLHMGFRLTLDPNMKFHGMIGGQEKNNIMDKSSGLVFPVIWHEPFGIAITESMYFGCPVYATPYGSISELVNPEIGFLSSKEEDIVNHINSGVEYNGKHIHEHVMEKYTVKQMVESFLPLYEKVMNGEPLNPTHPFYDKSKHINFLPFT